jgi:hypothetical protein
MLPWFCRRQTCKSEHPLRNLEDSESELLIGSASTPAGRSASALLLLLAIHAQDERDSELLERSDQGWSPGLTTEAGRIPHWGLDFPIPVRCPPTSIGNWPPRPQGIVLGDLHHKYRLEEDVA